MPLNIKLENFEGPFDLLLHLIKKNRMDIYEIKIHDITAQYLEYLKAMEEMDLEVTSEFILIAATLLEIKSRLLLPKSHDDDVEEDEGDTARELISKLEEYKRFKMAAEYLKGRLEGTGALYTKKAEIIEGAKKTQDPEDYLNKITMSDLYNLYINVISLQNEKLDKRDIFKRVIPIEKFKIEKKMEYIMIEIRKRKKMKFSSIVHGCSSKTEAIVLFLALLELIKLKRVKAYQESNFTDIYIREEELNEGN
ncbi:MAG: segregation/condensation protein A [Clostridiaceae bacterium]